MNNFKKNYSFKQRYNEAQRILRKHPERVPIIVDKHQDANNIPELDKKKFLVPGDLTVAQFIFVIRKRLKLSPEKAIFLFVGKNLPVTSSLISDVYSKYKDDDLFLYCFIMGENTFG
jgi:GABA(A) receptor-associated protein